jgi:hypothetical protein
MSNHRPIQPIKARPVKNEENILNRSFGKYNLNVNKYNLDGSLSNTDLKMDLSPILPLANVPTTVKPNRMFITKYTWYGRVAR